MENDKTEAMKTERSAHLGYQKPIEATQMKLYTSWVRNCTNRRSDYFGLNPTYEAKLKKQN